jgi:predicted DNA-binding transcriptional regulator AlpA
MTSQAPNPVTSSGDRLVSLNEVKRLTSLSTTSIYRRRGKTFPDNFKLKGSSRVVWSLRDIERWIAEQMNQSP